MIKVLPEISKQINSADILKVIEKNYSSIITVWAPMQIAWVNGAYQTFHDYEKFMIIMHLLKKTFDAYSKNFVILNYEEYFDQTKIEIEEINVMEISKSLNIPKETARRKINELEKLGTIKKIKKRFIIDRDTWPNIKPEETMKRITRFLSTLSKICFTAGLIPEPISSKKLTEVCKKYFSYIWKLYFEMQLPFLLNYKKLYGDLETFHVNGIVISNQVLNSKKKDNSEMSKEFYLEKYFFADQKNELGINAMSMSDITGIPRATVSRKLRKLVKDKYLQIDEKKHYSTTGTNAKNILEVQKDILKHLSKLVTSVYNLTLIKKN
jgi:Mn-dependent DtxR family transcriptional regulator